jgi:hypothetical protein
MKKGVRLYSKYRTMSAWRASGASGAAAGASCILNAGAFQNSETNTSTMMPMSRQPAAILAKGSFIQRRLQNDGALQSIVRPPAEPWWLER